MCVFRPWDITLWGGVRPSARTFPFAFARPGGERGVLRVQDVCSQYPSPTVPSPGHEVIDEAAQVGQGAQHGIDVTRVACKRTRWDNNRQMGGASDATFGIDGERATLPLLEPFAPYRGTQPMCSLGATTLPL